MDSIDNRAGGERLRRPKTRGGIRAGACRSLRKRL